MKSASILLILALQFFASTAFADAGNVVEDENLRLDQLFEQLHEADVEDFVEIEREIIEIWAHSGSAAMDMLLERGEIAITQRDYPKAIEHLSALIDHAPDFAEGWNARATAFFANDQYGPALADVERVLALEPRHFNALQGLGLIMQELGQSDLALRAFEMALAIHPNDPDLKQMLERLDAEAGDVDI